MNYTPEQLRVEIARRAPWYQCITFPDHGVTTTDSPAHALLDAAWDNKTDEISIEEAARLRPIPKWNFIQKVMPPVAGLDVLEIGSNCGFFSFEFARAGARGVTGLDVAPNWLGKAEWARSVLGLQNVSFHNCDFMRYDGTTRVAAGLLSALDNSIPLPDRLFDMVFMSTVLDHMFFPLFAIYKMCRISRRWVVIDVPVTDAVSREMLVLLTVPPDKSHHGFSFNPAFLTTYLGRLGIPASDVQVYPYNHGHNVTLVVDVTHLATGLQGA